jgi:hypothetical protein
MLQSAVAPRTGRVPVESPAWHKASCQKRAAVEAPSLVGWLAATAATVLITAGVVAALVAEYAVLWALLVAPWLDRVPAALPWAY